MNEEFRKLFRNFCKSRGLNPYKSPEIKKMIRDLDMDLSTVMSEIMDDNKIKTSEFRELADLHGKFVQDCINLINSSPGLQKMIEETREKYIKELNKDFPDEKMIIPDLRVYFGVDCLDESLIAGEWVPWTDSYMDISVGNSSVLYDI